MNLNPTIRFLKADDIHELIQLCKQHAAFEKSDYNETSKVEPLLKHFCEENSNYHCIVIEENEKLIGYATYMRQFSTWDAEHYVYMDCLFIEEGSRGIGIGQKLIDFIKKEAKRLGCDIIQWQTPSFNKRAIKFYERIGGYSKSKERYFLEIDSNN